MEDKFKKMSDSISDFDDAWKKADNIGKLIFDKDSFIAAIKEMKDLDDQMAEVAAAEGIKALAALSTGAQQLNIVTQDMNSMATVVKSNVEDTIFTLDAVQENEQITGDNKLILESYIGSLKDCLATHLTKSENLKKSVNGLA